MDQPSKPRRAAFAPLDNPVRLLEWPYAPLNWVMALAAIALALAGLDLGYALAGSVSGYLFDIAAYGADTIFAGGLIGLVIVWIRSIEGRPLATAGFRPADAQTIWLMVALAGLWVFSSNALGMIYDPEFRPLGTPDRATALTIAALEPWPLWLHALAVSIFAIAIVTGAVAEEVVYRAWALSSLTPAIGLGAAAIISSLLFAWSHVSIAELTGLAPVLSLVDYFFSGLLFCLLALRAGIGAASVFHTANNMLISVVDFIDGGGDIRYVFEQWAQPRANDDPVQAAAGLTLTLAVLGLVYVALPRQGWDLTTAQAR